MKVLHALGATAPEGARMVALRISSWLRAHGVESVIYGPTDTRAVGSAPTVEEGIHRVRVVPARARGASGELVELAALAARERPDVLHAHGWRGALACNAIGRVGRIPVVEHAHSLDALAGHKPTSFRSSFIFAVSPAVAAMVVERFECPAGRVVLAPNTGPFGGDVPRPRTEGGSRPMRVLGAGQLVDARDPLRFVRVVAAWSRRAPVEARWLGDGALRDAAAREAARLGAPVTFLGPSGDLARELDAADGLLVTSRHAGDPLAVLEAFARGRPVVAPKTGGLATQLGGERGVLVELTIDDEAFAARAAEALAFTPEVEARVVRASTYVRETRAPEVVLRPILDTYRALTS